LKSGSSIWGIPIRWILACSSFVVGNLALAIGYCWITSSYYRQDRFAYLLDNPTEIFSVRPLYLIAVAVIVGLTLFGLGWMVILTVRHFRLIGLDHDT
jgi:hypothetical protein